MKANRVKKIARLTLLLPICAFVLWVIVLNTYLYFGSTSTRFSFTPTEWGLVAGEEWHEITSGGTTSTIYKSKIGPISIEFHKSVVRVYPLHLTSAPDATAPVLLFCGGGSSPNDVKAVEAVLKERQLKYATVDSRQLNGMSAAQLMAHRLLIVPGGNYITMGNSLSPDASANVRTAVQGGMNYLGICAGGLLAGDAKVNTNSFNLTGVRFDFYAEVNRGIHKTTVTITNADTTAIEHYWEDGPQFAGWGDVVGKYPDGTPAIVEGACGKGWMILCGVHPEAPENWRHGMTFTTPASNANAYAGTLVVAALNGTRLPHY